MKLSLQQAGDACGVSKSTIYRAVKSGKLSATRNESDEYEIDPAELHRVFEPKQEAQQIESVSQSESSQSLERDAMMNWLRELADTQAETIARRDAEIQTLRDEVTAERERVEQYQTRLLEGPKRELQELSEQVQALTEKRGLWGRIFGS